MIKFVFIFVLVAGLAHILSRLASRVGLLAFPGDHREHRQPTPMVGGIAIFFGLVLGMLVIDQTHLGLLPSLLLLCIVGALDDRFKLPSWFRLVAQAIAAYLMILLSGVHLISLGQLWPGSEMLLGRWSTGLTIFATIGVINAINMSDGLDGLAGSLVVLVLATIYWLNPPQGDFVLVTIAAIAGFLFWNLRVFRDGAKVFMGDAGSTVLGLVIAYLLIRLSQNPDQIILPVTALWLLALPLFDTVAVLLVRPLRGKSPFAADRIHYHHLLHDRGMGVNSTLLSALFLQAGLIIVGMVMLRSGVAEAAQLLGFLFCFLLYVLVLICSTRSI